MAKDASVVNATTAPSDQGLLHLGRGPAAATGHDDNHVDADAKAGCFVSRYHDCFPFRLYRYTTQGILTAIFKNKGDRLGQTLPGLLLGAPLTIGAGDFGAVGNKPLAVSFDDRGKFISAYSTYKL